MGMRGLFASGTLLLCVALSSARANIVNKDDREYLNARNEIVFRAVGKVLCANILATGTLIRDDLVITVGHYRIPKKADGWEDPDHARQVSQCRFDLIGSEGQTVSSHRIIEEKSHYLTNGDRALDWAVLHIAPRVPSDVARPMAIVGLKVQEMLTLEDSFSIAFHGDYPERRVHSPKCRPKIGFDNEAMSKGAFDFDADTMRFLLHWCDTVPGTSGGLIYSVDRNDRISGFAINVGQNLDTRGILRLDEIVKRPDGGNSFRFGHDTQANLAIPIPKEVFDLVAAR